MKRDFDWSKSIFLLKTLELNYKNLYYFKKNVNNVKIYYNYSFRIYVFFKLNEFLKINNFKKNQFLNILFNDFSLLLNFFLKSKNPQLYYYLIKIISLKYKNLNFSEKNEFFFQNYSGSFSNLLNFFDIKYNKQKQISLNNLKNLETKIEKKINNLKNLKINNLNFLNNFENSKFSINFLRIQRRYNKRRYSKVRTTSRPSFFAGISLSSIFLGLLWGGSIKGVDWLTSWIIIIDMNFFFFILFSYFIFRIWRINYLNNFIRKKNKITIINTLHKMFIFNFFINN